MDLKNQIKQLIIIMIRYNEVMKSLEHNNSLYKDELF